MPAGDRKGTTLLTSDALRFLQIERTLRSGGVSAAQLRAALQISQATLKRDLKALRDELGAPICYDRATDQYRLTMPWTGVRACLLEAFR